MNYAETFKNIYFTLYSNSSSSRAENIIADLSRILLIKLASEKLNSSKELDSFLSGKSTATKLLELKRKAFPKIADRNDRFHLRDSDLIKIFKELSNVTLHDAPSHIIGDAFQALIGPKIRGDKGQFFTPLSLVRCMVKILDPQLSDTVIDPACGTGGFLSATYAHWEQKDKKISGKLIGGDKDKDLAYFATALLEVATHGKADILNVNSLDFFIKPENNPKADIVLTNPPFGSKIKITEKDILKNYDLGHNWNYLGDREGWIKTDITMEAQDPQVLFLELCVRSLKPGGKMGIVLSEGIFGNKTFGYVWDYLKANGEIIALLDNPRTAFQPYTDTKTNVLFFVKKLNNKIQNNKTLVGVALNCGHDRRGRNKLIDGTSYPDDYPAIAEDFIQHQYGKSKNGKYWFESKLDSYYKVPRYYTVNKDLKKLQEIGQLVTLGELTRKGYLYIRKGNEVGSEAYGTGDVPFVRTSDINNLEISFDPTKSISEDIYEKIAPQQNLRPGTILMVADGRYRIGKTAIIPNNGTKILVQSHIKILSLSETAPISPYEFLYLLNLPEVQSQIRSLVFIQSTLGTLGKRLEQVRIPVPKKGKEWTSIINDFQTTLEQRAVLLEKIKSFAKEAEL